MNNLSTKLLAMVLSVILIGTTTLTAAGIFLFQRYLLEESMDTLSRHTGQEAERINGWVENHIYFIKALSDELYFLDDYSRENLLPRLSLHLDEMEYSDVYVGFPDGTIIMSTGYVPDYSEYSADLRPWYQGAVSNPDAVYISAPYIEIESQQFCVAITKAIIKNGEIVAVVGVDVNLNTLWDIVNEANIGKDGYAFLSNGSGYILNYPNEDYILDDNGNFQHITDIENGTFKNVWENIVDGQTVKIKTLDGITRFYSTETISATGWRIYTAVAAHNVLMPLYQLILLFTLISVTLVLVASILTVRIIQKMIISPIMEVTESADNLAQGSTLVSFDSSRQDEFGILMTSFSKMAHSINEQVLITKQIASGNLTCQIPVRSETDVMGQSLNDLVQHLNKIVRELTCSSLQISSGSREISHSMLELSRGTTEQATSVQDIMEFMNEITSILFINDEKNFKSMNAGDEVRIATEESRAQMHKLFLAVKEITEASENISTVIKTIEFIAFKTNILSINASIEASRAGEAGKGFAVVAEEIRNLSIQSSEAAKQTGASIETAITRARESAKIARQTECSMNNIMESITNAINLINEFGHHSKQQGQEIRKLGKAIEQINDVILSNATSAEQCAAASEALHGESEKLMEIVRRFNIKDNE